jgi:hypothetical protein
LSVACIVQEGCPQKLRAHYLTNSIQCLRYILTRCDDYAADFNAYCCIGDAELVDCLLSHGYTWSPDTLSLCAARNLLPMVRLLHERGCTTWGAAAKQAAHNDNLELFAFALERGAAGLVNSELHSLVTYKQKWACFEYALEHSTAYTADVAIAAATHCLPALKYLRDHGYAMDTQACMRNAVNALNMDAMLYVHQEGAQWPWDTPSAPAAQNRCDCGRLVIAAISRYCANLEDLCFLVDQGCRLTSAATAQAAGLGLLDCLYYLHQHGCALAANAVAQAAVGGHIDCIAFLLPHGCVLTSDAALRATTSGNVDCLRWLLARSCPLSHESAYQAALRGDFDCLRC